MFNRSAALYLVIFLSVVLSNCENNRKVNPPQPKQSVASPHVDTTKPASTTRQFNASKYYTTKDTLIIRLEIGDSLMYSKEEFNHIVDNHPEFFENWVQDPDMAYNCADKEGFGGEAGQDGYYVLYAYFLKQRNSVNKYAERRKNLINIYENINHLFQQLQSGGTYFGHQTWRILGYAEFSVYLYSQLEKTISQGYNISDEKELYIKSLRLQIGDVSSMEGGVERQEKIKRNKELNDIVNKISQAISDIFYLRRAQGFQYGNYEYY